jgi:hypothetical protein
VVYGQSFWDWLKQSGRRVKIFRRTGHVGGPD